MSIMDTVQIIFLIVVVAVGVGGMIWVIKNEKK
jgi:heme/copper-type cytochrome/quinol oxidase subunit 4